MLQNILIDISKRYNIPKDELFERYIESNDKKTIEIFTDGSFKKKNGIGKAGIGIFFGDNDPRNVSKLLDIDSPSNNKAELTAIKTALKITKNDNIPCIIYSDSEYSINSVTKWYKNWIKNDWKTSTGKDVKNIKIIKSIIKYLDGRQVEFIHVRSHTNEPSNKNTRKYFEWYGNDQADHLAQKII